MNPPAPASTGITAASPQAPTALPQTATAVPTFDTQGTLGAIRNFYQIPQAAQAAGVVGQGLAGQSDYQNKRNEIQANYAREQAQHETEASAYRLQNDPNGGPSRLYNIFTGRQVSALEYNHLTGADPTEPFKTSQNQADRSFAKDYQDYETYMQNFLNLPKNPFDKQGNPTNEAAAVVKSYWDDLKNRGIDLQHMNNNQVTQLFSQKYGHYLGGNESSQTQPFFTPQYDPQMTKYLFNRSAAQANPIQSGTSSGAGNAIANITSNPNYFPQAAAQSKKKK